MSIKFDAAHLGKFYNTMKRDLMHFPLQIMLYSKRYLVHLQLPGIGLCIVTRPEFLTFQLQAPNLMLFPEYFIISC